MCQVLGLDLGETHTSTVQEAARTDDDESFPRPPRTHAWPSRSSRPLCQRRLSPENPLRPRRGDALQCPVRAARAVHRPALGEHGPIVPSRHRQSPAGLSLAAASGVLPARPTSCHFRCRGRPRVSDSVNACGGFLCGCGSATDLLFLRAGSAMTCGCRNRRLRGFRMCEHPSMRGAAGAEPDGSRLMHDGVGEVEQALGLGSWSSEVAGEGGGDGGLVLGGEDGAEDGDAEGAADLANVLFTAEPVPASSWGWWTRSGWSSGAARKPCPPRAGTVRPRTARSTCSGRPGRDSAGRR